jgi:hypothetical protein
MPERYIQALVTDNTAGEAAAATRERLKANFPAGATRRMTNLGLLVGSALARLAPSEDDSVVYATGYAESRALEGFLDSFPTPSPTLFQTSIHPSAVQQLMIGRQQQLRELMPISGGALMAFHAVRASLLSPARRSILCGGEERGSWLLNHGLASDRTFAFALALTAEETADAAGRVRISRDAGDGRLDLPAFFDLLDARRPFDGMVAPGWRLALEWR